MSGVSPYELLTFASSSVAAALGALLLGLRIPGGQALGTLRTARGYLALSCFIWAAAGFAGTFLHPDVGDSPDRPPDRSLLRRGTGGSKSSGRNLRASAAPRTCGVVLYGRIGKQLKIPTG